jgi:hypothetical protein
VIIILIGFATHRETGLSFLPRMGALFFPLMISWLLVAPWLELFQEEIIFNPKQLWRPAFAILFAAPLATVLRGLILNAPIIPIFVIVLGGTLTLGMTLWRGIYFLMNRREQS